MPKYQSSLNDYTIHETTCQVRYNALCIYDKITYERGSRKFANCYAVQRRELNNRYTGIMNPQVAKRISRAVSLMLQSSSVQHIYNPVSRKYTSFRFNFITLTIPDNSFLHCTPEHPPSHLTRMQLYKIPFAWDYIRSKCLDKSKLKSYYKLLLRPFLQWMTKYKNVHTYIWKAEFQKRLQAHYHITTTTWISTHEMAAKWNYLIEKNGLMSIYKMYNTGRMPPSVHVRKVTNKRNLQAYLSKELCKGVQNQISICSKVWDCSANLKAFKYFSLPLNTTHEKRLLQLDDKKIISLWQNDFCTIIRLKQGYQQYLLSKKEKDAYQLFLNSIQMHRQPLFD